MLFVTEWAEVKRRAAAANVDRGLIHSHILVNTYTLTDRKVNANKATLDYVNLQFSGVFCC